MSDQKQFSDREIVSLGMEVASLVHKCYRPVVTAYHTWHVGKKVYDGEKLTSDDYYQLVVDFGMLIGQQYLDKMLEAKKAEEIKQAKQQLLADKNANPLDKPIKFS